MKTVFRNILALTVSLLAMPLLCGAEAVAPRSTGPSEAGKPTGTTNQMNKGKPLPNARDHAPKDLTDINAWEKLQSGPFAETDSNRYRLAQEKAGLVIESETTLPEGPGVISYGVIATRERHGTPGLKGTLIFEVDLVDYTNSGEYLNKYMSAIGQPSDHEDPIFGNYLMGWGITIGNVRGFVTGIDDGDRKRAVQFHFDGYSKKGFFSTLCRQISTQDQQKYRRFAQTELMEYLADYFAGKETYEDAVRRVVPYRSMDDATALYSRHWPATQGGNVTPAVVRGRFGIMLSNDGNTLSWLLDGKVMDSCDITGYFSSSTDDFAEGVYISIGAGAGFRKNLWRFANPRLTVKPAKETTMGTRFGVNSFLGNIAHSEIRGAEGGVKPAAEDRTHYLDALKDLGVDVMRETFAGWAEVEPERGKGYRWEVYDDLARKASERGIEIVALQYPFPEWATGRAATPPTQPFRFMYDLPGREFEPDFRRFVRALVARYCGHGPEALPLKIPVRTWIFGNEQDIHFNQPGARNVSPDDYAFWLKAFYEEVKAADAGATVAAGGLGRTIELKDDRFWGSVWKGRDSSGVGLAYFDRVLDSANLQGPAYPYFDIQPFHGYVGFYERDKSPAENAAASLRELSESPRNIASRLRARKIDAALWLTETGALEFSPKDQPAAAIMAVVHGASTGVPIVILHGLWDIPGNEFGLLENTPSGQAPVRKPLFTAYQTLIRLIGRNEGVQCLAPGRYRARLPGGKAVYVLWTLDNSQTKVDFIQGPVRVTDLRGNQQEIDAAALMLSDQPCFVEPLTPSKAGGKAPVDTKVTIDTGKHLGRISPLLYGLRGADTFKNDTPLMWVGPDSPIANIDGVRQGTVEALRKIQPGFMSGLVGAEWYRWQDGIGPRDKRPVRVSYWGRSAFEAANMEWRNEFGTEEFLHLCRLVGTEPLMICNAEDPIGSRDWVEYCNWDGDSTFARMRAANGHPAPHEVKLWNMYGWMDMEPEEYASSFRRFASGVRPLDPKTKLIAAGGGNEWNQRFFDKLKRCMSPNFGGPDVVDYLSQIYYTGQGLPDVDYSDEQYYRVLQNSFGVEGGIAAVDALLKPLDAARQPWGIHWLHLPEIGTPTIQLAILEWGTVHFMGRQTMREAVAHAIFLDRFHKWAARVSMASVFLNMVVQSQGDRLILTPTYHLYDLYRPHRGKQSVAVDVDCPRIRGGGLARPEDSKGSGGAVAGSAVEDLPELPMLSASASVADDGRELVVTVTNCHLTEPARVVLAVAGNAKWRIASIRTLSSQNVRDFNAVEDPDRVCVHPGQAEGSAVELAVTVEPFSITAIVLAP